MCAAPWWEVIRTDSTVYGMMTKTLVKYYKLLSLLRIWQKSIHLLHLTKKSFHNEGDVKSWICVVNLKGS